MTDTLAATAEPFPYRFADLVDLNSFSKVLDNFHQATGLANGVVDASGELLTQSGWTRACTAFHRDHALSHAQCIASNLKLMGSLQAGCIHSDLCLNGLSDYATPVTIEGHPLATLFLGQVLHTPPDLDRFRQQARQFGYDTEAYLAAIQAIPVVPRAQVESLMTVMVSMAEMLAASGLARLRQKTLEQHISESDERRIQLEDILDASPVATGWSHRGGRIEYINHQFTQLFGYTLADLPDLTTWYTLAYPDAEYRAQVIQPWNDQVNLARAQGLPPPELLAQVTCKGGQVRHVNIRVSWVGERRLVNFSDITELWESKQRIKAHDAMLDMVARGVDLDTVLHSVVLQVEAEDPSARCSILLLDEDKECLRTAAAPHLPGFYSQAIDGTRIGPRVGSCGTAAYTGQRVIVEDIATSSLWTEYASLAATAHLRACWSEPILSTHGKVLGTFAIYHAEPMVPTAADIKRITTAANLCAVAIENRQTREALEQRANTDELTSLPNRRAFMQQAQQALARAKRHPGCVSVLMLDIDHFKRVNDTHGHQTGDAVLIALARLCQHSLREGDLMGRMGGEEFAILLPDSPANQAWDTAERLRRTVAQTPMVLEPGPSLGVTVSIGVTTTATAQESLEALLSQADDALYQAKNQGRNRVCQHPSTSE
jgi:diguanylate cyclase (GGDEF)-like protein/PAS domain S-box-containing protein